jgi:DNA-binding NarL/FixJ family response regulator
MLEECPSEEIVIFLRNVLGRASVFRSIDEIHWASEELRNEGCPGRTYQNETDAIRSILQEDPNASLKTIAETLSFSPQTVRTHMSRTGYTLKTLH